MFNPLNAELNPTCHLLALLGAHHIPHVSRISVNFVVYPFSLFFLQTLLASDFFVSYVLQLAQVLVCRYFFSSFNLLSHY